MSISFVAFALLIGHRIPVVLYEISFHRSFSTELDPIGCFFNFAVVLDNFLIYCNLLVPWNILEFDVYFAGDFCLVLSVLIESVALYQERFSLECILTINYRK